MTNPTFLALAGHAALGTRLRRLSEQLMSDAVRLYDLYGVELDPRWFPVFYMLSQKDSATITELAQDIGQSHPAVSQVVNQMTLRGMVSTAASATDARVTVVALTEQGRTVAARFQTQFQDVTAGVDGLFAETGIDLWVALDAFEQALARSGLFDRVSAIRKTRESSVVAITPYAPKYKRAFRTLNEEWISAHWELEDTDRRMLDDPRRSILDKGGYIAFAVRDGEALGTCSLLDKGGGTFELAKMGVTAQARGLGIGMLLGRHMVDKARELGARRLYIESNTVLAPAISLYRKLGFVQIPMQPSPYQRCNIQMELLLDC